jgi:hypothetical protein
LTRRYSAAEKAKRDKKFRVHLAKRENPVRFAHAIPEEVNLADISWSPDHLEEIADKLARMKARWIKEDDERRRKRAAEILAEVKRDT